MLTTGPLVTIDFQIHYCTGCYYLKRWRDSNRGQGWIINVTLVGIFPHNPDKSLECNVVIRNEQFLIQTSCNPLGRSIQIFVSFELESKLEQVSLLRVIHRREPQREKKTIFKGSDLEF